MNIAGKTLKKICAVCIIIALTISDFLFIGNAAVSYAVENAKTNNSNVTFSAYFLNSNGEKVERLEQEIDTEEKFLYVDISVKNEGYFNGNITLENNNFNLKNDIVSPDVAEITSNTVKLNQINAGSTVTVKLGIETPNNNTISKTMLDTKSSVVLNGQYVNSKNVENKKYINIKGTDTVEMSWLSSKNSVSELEAELLTNYTYKVDGKLKRVVQVEVNSKVTNNNYPVKNTEVVLDVPATVENVSVHTRGTNATNSNISFNENNYVYDKEKNTLTINVANENENSISWNKNVNDTFIVTYVFDVNEVVDNKDITVNNTINTYDNKKLTNTKSVHIEKEVDGIVSYSINSEESYIYKGKLYSGEDRLYNTVSKVNIDLIGDVNTINFKETEAVFNSGNNSLAGNIALRQSKINKAEFLNIFGENGSITVKNSEGVIITTINKDSNVDENGYIVINYNGLQKAAEFVTSAPVKVGTLNIYNTKAIMNSGLSREQINDLTGIKENIEGKYNEKATNKNNVDIELKNTSSQAMLNVSTDTLSVVDKNENIKITAVLLNNDESKDLYKNPKLRIAFPSQVVGITGAKCKVLYGNGLTLANPKIVSENGKYVIELDLNGTQAAYNTETLEGTTVIIYVNLEVNKLATNSDEFITLNYTNEIASSYTDNGEQKAPVKISAVNEVLTTNNLKELNVATIGNNEDKKVLLDVSKEQKDVTVEISAINNEGSSISNVTILGKFPTLTNLGISLLSGITNVNGTKGVNIYYSDKEDVTDDLSNTANNWKKELDLSKAKTYLIVIDEMQVGESFNANYKIGIPANLTYNNSAEESYVVNYKNNLTSTPKSVKATALSLTTGTGAEMTTSLKAYVADKEVKDGDTVNSGEVVKYVLTVKNDGTEQATNVSVETKVPENCTYVKYVKASDNGDEDGDSLASTSDYYNEEKTNNGKIIENIDKIEIGEEKTFIYEVKVNDKAKNSTISTESVVSYKGSVNTEGNATSKSNVISNNVNAADVDTSLIMISRGEDKVLTGLSYAYSLSVKNTSGRKLSNVEVNIKTNSAFTVERVIDGENLIEVKDNKFVINTLNPDEIKTIEINVMTVGNEGNATIYTVTNNQYYSNEVTDPIKATDVEVSMKSSTEGESIKNGDKITYNINVTNKGTEDIQYLEINQQISNYLNIDKVRVNGTEVKYDKVFIPSEEKNEENTENKDENTSVTEESEKYNIGFNYANVLKPGESLQIDVETTTDEEEKHENNIHLASSAEVRVKNLAVQTEEVNHILTANINSKEDEEQLIEDNEDNNEQNGENQDGNNENNDNGNGENTNNGSNTNSANLNTISGTAWLDTNENGTRDSNEKTLGGIKVKLMNLDDNTTMETTTSENGFYSFSNVKNGKYVAIFEYDTEKYILTTYQAEGVNSSRNSDVENVNMNIEDTSTKVASTDTLTVNGNNLTNIDIGLLEAKTFDLSLSKAVSKVTVTNSAGTKSQEYADENIAKVEIKAKNLSGTLVAIEYKIKVTNNGELAGYVKQIVDYKPTDLIFNSSLNPAWYQSGDYLYTTALADTKIEAGETKELTLVLTKKMTETNTGLTNNIAEISKDFNSLGIADTDSVAGNKKSGEDDMGSCNVIISVSTGAAVSYVAITLSIIAIISVGAYIAARKVLKENINI